MDERHKVANRAFLMGVMTAALYQALAPEGLRGQEFEVTATTDERGPKEILLTHRGVKWRITMEEVRDDN